MAQDGAGGSAAARHVEVVDAVAAAEHAVDHGQQLGAACAGRAAQADQLVGGRLDAEPLGQGGGQQQPGVGHGMVVIEADLELVQGRLVVVDYHRKGALLRGSNGRLSNAILPGQRAFSGSDHAYKRS